MVRRSSASPSPGGWGAPFVPFYASAMLLRRALYDRGMMPSAKAAAWCVSVGGLEAGGSGKTPVTALVLKAYRAAGRHVGLLTRGYGRATSRLAFRAPGEAPRPEVIGDEPAMLVSGGLDIPVAACGRRRIGAAALVDVGCDTIVLDDAFQHRALARNLDIVVLRGEAPFGNGHLLPWGSLREPPSSLSRAHVVWLHYRGEAPKTLPAWTRELRGAPTIVLSEHRSTEPCDLHGHATTLRGQRVLAAAGIARPSDFAASLKAMDVEVVNLVTFPDHHVYTRFDLVHLGRRLQSERATALVVTPKDAIKIACLDCALPVVVVGSRVAVTHGHEMLAACLHVSPTLI